jgi:hypothetical protein
MYYRSQACFILTQLAYRVISCQVNDVIRSHAWMYFILDDYVGNL